MINHVHKCIFIHIPRTAGSCIETLIDERNWWEKSLRPQKHLLASQAKEIYASHWDKYFKFSIVRNPWARMVSMLKWGHFYGVSVSEGLLDLAIYKKQYGFPAAVEYDQRYHSPSDIPKGRPGRGYSNILNEKLDFVGTYENLEEDSKFIFQQIGLKKRLSFERAPAAYDSAQYQPHYTPKTEKEVDLLYRYDNLHYNYCF